MFFKNLVLICENDDCLDMEMLSSRVLLETTDNTHKREELGSIHEYLLTTG